MDIGTKARQLTRNSDDVPQEEMLRELCEMTLRICSGTPRYTAIDGRLLIERPSLEAREEARNDLLENFGVDVFGYALDNEGTIRRYFAKN